VKNKHKTHTHTNELCFVLIKRKVSTDKRPLSFMIGLFIDRWTYISYSIHSFRFRDQTNFLW